MSELAFVAKTFLVAAAIVTLMQIRISGTSLEQHAQSWLQNSSVAHFVQGAAVGGVLATRDLYHSLVNTWQGNSAKPQSSKASK